MKQTPMKEIERNSNTALSKDEQVETPRRPIVYIDMDGVLVDFESGVAKAEPSLRARYANDPDLIPGVFNLMDPMPGAVEAVKTLSEKYDLYILSTASWNNPLCWMEKRQWVGRYFGETFHKKLILTHHKNLNRGDYLIDDRTHNVASEFEGELIPFATDRFPDWPSVVDYLMTASPSPSVQAPRTQSLHDILTASITEHSRPADPTTPPSAEP